MKIFARINHAAGAATVDKELPPTELVIFGNPKVGAPLMQVHAQHGHRPAAEGADLTGTERDYLVQL